MAIDVTMPQMGESVVEGTIAKWLVKEGDVVIEDQPLVEISTDKVDTEIPSPGAGPIAKIVAAEGQTLPVGATLAVIEPEVYGLLRTQDVVAYAPPAGPDDAGEFVVQRHSQFRSPAARLRKVAAPEQPEQPLWF